MKKAWEMDVGVECKQLWCPCRREGGREKKREERSEGCLHSESASSGV